MQPAPVRIVACPQCAAPYYTVGFSGNPERRSWSIGLGFFQIIPLVEAFTQCSCGAFFWEWEAVKITEVPAGSFADQPGDVSMRPEPFKEKCHVEFLTSRSDFRDDQIADIRMRIWWRYFRQINEFNELMGTSVSCVAPAVLKRILTMAKKWMGLEATSERIMTRNEAIDRLDTILNLTEHSRKDILTYKSLLQKLVLLHRDEQHANLVQLVPLLDEHDPDQKLIKAEVLRNLGRFRQAYLLLRTIKKPERVISEMKKRIVRLDREPFETTGMH